MKVIFKFSILLLVINCALGGREPSHGGEDLPIVSRATAMLRREINCRDWRGGWPPDACIINQVVPSGRILCITRAGAFLSLGRRIEEPGFEFRFRSVRGACDGAVSSDGRYIAVVGDGGAVVTVLDGKDLQKIRRMSAAEAGIVSESGAAQELCVGNSGRVSPVECRVEE